jgi:pilus assembly protein CpaF
LLVELLRKQLGGVAWSGEAYPFAFRVTSRESASFYEVSCTLPAETIAILRGAVDAISSGLDPREVEPLTFERLIEVLSQHAAEELGERGLKARVKEAAELAAFEAIGLSRILALAKDEKVTEFFADSDMTPIYLDHSEAGRCETSIVLTERERTALETHLDTFSGYTLDFKTPSMKNDMKMAGALLRVSLDLEPISVNRFALDVRRLNVSSLSLERLVALGVISDEAAAFLVAWIELGGNVTIVGETGTGKTTLLNALDEQVERTLRRLYIEDAVETRDLLGKGYHQMKVKVDPFERGDDSGRTKEQEIVKALHRSPDIVVLSEIQSEEHSHAFFHALAAGARGMQTFHASSIEQAIRRWVNMHHIPEQCLFDLGVMVQMSRPDRLKQKRVVQRLCAVVQEGGAPRAKELYLRDRQSRLCNVAGGTWPRAPEGVEMAKFEAVAVAALRRLRGQ